MFGEGSCGIITANAFNLGSNDALSMNALDLRINHGGVATTIGIGRGNQSIPINLQSSISSY